MRLSRGERRASQQHGPRRAPPAPSLLPTWRNRTCLPLSQSIDVLAFRARVADNRGMKPIIFVSCGQVTPEEINLGKDIVDLIRRDGRYEPYFAEDQSSVEAVTSNILAKLDAAAGFVAVMHPRGEIGIRTKDTSDKHITRASVWIEQEIAILAMLVQVQHRNVKVQLYAKHGIAREGLRLYVMTNPYEFSAESEVLQHFGSVIGDWNLVPHLRGVALRPVLVRRPQKQNPAMYTIGFALHNCGDERPTDARVRIRMPMKYIRHSYIPNTKTRNTHLELELDQRRFEAEQLFEQLYPHETTRILQEIWFYVEPGEVPPISDVMEIEVRSGNGAPFIGRVTIAGLQNIPTDLLHHVTPEVKGFSMLEPFSPAPP